MHVDYMWIQKYLCQDTKDWHYTFESFCSKNNLALFLRSNFITDELPFCVPDYYVDSVKAWREVKYDEVTSPEDLHNQFLWYNRNVLIDGKTLYNARLSSCGLWKVTDLYKQGTLINFDTWKQRGAETKDFLSFQGILFALPHSWTRMLKNMVEAEVPAETMRQEKIS